MTKTKRSSCSSGSVQSNMSAFPHPSPMYPESAAWQRKHSPLLQANQPQTHPFSQYQTVRHPTPHAHTGRSEALALSGPNSPESTASSTPSGLAGLALGHPVAFGSPSVDPVHGAVAGSSSTMQFSGHNRTYSDPKLPFQKNMESKQWQQSYASEIVTTDAARGPPVTAVAMTMSQEPSFAGLENILLPSELQSTFHDWEQPWTFFEDFLRPQPQDLFAEIDDEPQRAKSTSSTNPLNWTSADYDRAGKRNGPLSTETRQNANDVRGIGSCLRCFVMRESCDTQTPCRNCEGKEARSWKFGKQCIRPRLPQRAHYLLPEPLIARLRKHYVDDFIRQRGWRTGTTRFALPLEIGLDDRLDLPVREYLPCKDDPEYRPAYRTSESSTDAKADEMYEYDLPVVLFAYSEHLVAQEIRAQLGAWFQKVLATLNNPERSWARLWFDAAPHDDFLAEIMSVICRYYRQDLSHHQLILSALAISFFNYIYSHSFTVPKDEIDDILRQMESRPKQRPYNIDWAAPSAINKYIKMILRPPMTNVISRTMKSLEALLLSTDNRSTWRRDVIFSVAFIIIAHLGKTQAALVQLAAQPEATDSMGAFTQQEAEREVILLERECIDIITNYLRQFLVPSARRKHYSNKTSGKSAKSLPSDNEAEKHAEHFDFMAQITRLRDSYRHVMPASFEVDKRSTVSSFMAQNTNRVCWKFLEAVLAEMP